ncbi:hypothetical protein OXIME_001167 [Oxyplasma meridianum]|uniref:Peptidase S53 domain-containing protein n=1 Tax=Oxyplasma meridianum TaxID=3073602 RepID=A0AAX4NHP7_9ARCH
MTLTRIQAVAIIWIMIMVLAVPAITDNNTSYNANNADFSTYNTGTWALNASGWKLYYTVYDPSQTNFTDSVIMHYLSSIGVPAQNYGVFLNFNLNSSMKKNVDNFLNGIKSVFGIEYAETSGSVNVYPNILYSSVPNQLGMSNSYYVPQQIASAYDFNWAYHHNIKGNGTTIGIVDAYGDPNIEYDLGAFDNSTGLPSADLKVIYVSGKSSQSSFNNSWAIETATDVEWAHAMAPYAKIVLLLADSSSFSAMQRAVEYAVNNKISDTLSFSWGSPESGVANSTLSSFNLVLQAATDEGISIFAASGDNGAYDNTNKLTVNFPASSPYVTSVGGTSLYYNNGVFSQLAWGGNLSGKSYGSGGGYSSYFSKPYWQMAPSLNDSITQRGVPDVSLDADNNTGVVIISEGKAYKVGGTSIATPMWAAIGSLIDQYNGRKMGLLNPMFYQISRTDYYGKAFTQITSGGNGYYSAHSGWNPVTGLGTPNVSELLNVSADMLLPYGSNVIINSGNFSYNGVSAVVNLSGPNSANQFGNGSTLYYVSLFSNNSNFIRFGLDRNSTAIFPMFQFDQGGVWINETYDLPGGSSNKILTSGNPGYNVSIIFRNDTVSLSVNGTNVGKRNIFPQFQGSMEASYGVEQLNSKDNLTPVAGGSFSNLSVYANTSTMPVTSMFETHFSGVTDQLNYSNLSIFSADGLYQVENGYSNNSAYINGSASPSSALSISYNLSFSSPVNGTFKLHGKSENVKWEVNGTPITGSTYSFPSHGYYNVSAYQNENSSILSSGGIGKYLASREVFIPVVLRSHINITSNISYDMTPKVSLTLNGLYSFTLDGETAIPVLSGSNSISARLFGFMEINKNVTGGEDYNFTISALPVYMKVFVNPGYANVTANQIPFKETNGVYTLSTFPREVFLNASAEAYKPASNKVSLKPGITYSTSLYLTPLHAIQKITGRVIDRIFKYGLYGVNVSSNSSNYFFTNATGYYVFYNSYETKNLTFSRPGYNSATVEVDSTANETINVPLVPMDINASSLFSVNLGRYFPFLFSLAYISWSGTPVSPQLFGSYQIIYADNSHMDNPAYLNISNPGTQSSVLAGIFPGKTYYVTINMYLRNGQIVTGNTITISYANLIDLAANLVILTGVIIYTYIAAGFIRRRINRKKSN